MKYLKGLVILAAILIPLILVFNGQYWALILLPVSLGLAEVFGFRFRDRTYGYRMQANRRAKERRWQRKIDSQATAKYDPDFWDSRKAYNQQVGLAAPNPPVAQPN